MKNYEGARTIDGVRVLVDGKLLDERTDIRLFSTSGFEWTYAGDAPRQLALALLADHLEDDGMALQLSESFMNDPITQSLYSLA